PRGRLLVLLGAAFGAPAVSASGVVQRLPATTGCSSCAGGGRRAGGRGGAPGGRRRRTAGASRIRRARYAAGVVPPASVGRHEGQSDHSKDPIQLTHSSSPSLSVGTCSNPPEPSARSFSLAECQGTRETF